MSLMPETPFYLMLKGREDLAQQSLQWLRGRNHDISKELNDIRDSANTQKNMGTLSISELFTNGVYVKPLLIMLFLMFLQQYCGINAVTFNLQKIFETANTSWIKPGLASSLVALAEVLSNIAAIFVIDRLGRRLLLTLSNIFVGLAILSLGVFFYLQENHEECQNSKEACHHAMSNLHWLPLSALVVYFFAFSIGNGPIPWTMNGEIFPLEVKNIGSSMAIAFSWFCTILVTKFEFDVQAVINLSGAFFFYASVCALATVVIVFFIPETKGRSPEELKELFLQKQVYEEVDKDDHGK